MAATELSQPHHAGNDFQAALCPLFITITWLAFLKDKEDSLILMSQPSLHRNSFP